MKKLLPILLLLAACSPTNPAQSQLPTIVTGAFPVAWLSAQLSGDCAAIIDLTPAGGDVHDLELTPNQTAEIVEADLVITTSGFQPAFDDAVKTTTATVLDLVPEINPILSGDHSHESDEEHAEESQGEKATDPHFWLDPNRMILAANLIAEQISSLSQTCEQQVSANLELVINQLVEINSSYLTNLAYCDSRTLVVSHEAFGYLADAYQLEQIAVAGLDPESEPSAARIREIIDLAQTSKVAAVFTEESANPAVAEILAAELSVNVLPLNPIELKPASLDYLTVMRENLKNLTNGLSCR